MAIPGAVDSRCKTVLLWGTCTMLRRVDWFDAQRCYSRRMAHVWVEKLVQGPEKSACFFGLLRWSVGCHCLLRSRCPCSDQLLNIKQSAFMTIAFEAIHLKLDILCPSQSRVSMIWSQSKWEHTFYIFQESVLCCFEFNCYMSVELQ